MRLIKGNVERVAEGAQAEKLKALGFAELVPAGQQPLPAQSAPVTLADMTVAELKELAKAKDIKGAASLTKEELLKVLKDVV